jgi:AcrR family transcriptional regulator
MKTTDRKLEIITIAAQLFKEKGYSAVTMRDIAQAMNIKAASLYNHLSCAGSRKIMKKPL